MSVEGLWTASMFAPGQFGAGVVVFETGRVFGGDSSMYYTGSYQINGRQLLGLVRVRKHHDIPGIVPFAGMDDAEFQIEATMVADTKIQFSAKVVKPKQGPQVIGELMKLDGLP